jgi:hypothetical protein
MWMPTIPHISTYACQYIIVTFVNVMWRSTTFSFTPYHDLDEDMWDDMESGISHLSLLILVLTRGCPFNILCGLG